MKERREANKKTKKKSDRKEERQAGEREKEREAKEVSSGCQAGGSASRCNHGSGTGRYGNQQSRGKKKRRNTVRSSRPNLLCPSSFFLKEGNTRRNYVKQHSLFATFWYFTSSQMICFSTWNPTCGGNALVM